jgi:hypothetical protein
MTTPTTKLDARYLMIKARGTATVNLSSLAGHALFGSETMDFGSVSAGVTADSTGATITGAAAGDFVQVSATVQTAGLVYTGYVSATDTVKTRISNVSAGAIDPASQTLLYKVSKQAANWVSQDVTVPGAALGDLALASFGVDVADLHIDAQVTAANTVTLTIVNLTGAAVDLASTTVRVLVFDGAAGT